MSHVQSTKVLTYLKKSLLPLMEKNSNFDEVSISLFRLEFSCKSKELVDQVNAIMSIIQEDTKVSFFDRASQESERGLQPKTCEKWSPNLQEEKQTVTTAPESLVDKQVINCHL